MAFLFIGLSCLQINQSKKAERNSALSAEARRILSILADCPTDAITKDKNGRPFFQNGNADFSISHSGSIAAVSLIHEANPHRSPSGQMFPSAKFRTGCDIQLIRPRKNLRNIAEENFYAAENDYIFLQNETQFECARFYQIWTLKECYIKLRGLSVFDMLKAPSFIRAEEFYTRLLAPEVFISGREKQFKADAARINDATPFRSGAAYDTTGGSSSLLFYQYELSYTGEHYMVAAVIEKDSITDHGRGIDPEIRIFSQPEGNLVLSSSGGFRYP